MLVEGLSVCTGGDSCPGGFLLNFPFLVGFQKLSLADPDYVSGMLSRKKSFLNMERSWLLMEGFHSPLSLAHDSFQNFPQLPLEKQGRMGAFSQRTFLEIKTEQRRRGQGTQKELVHKALAPS